MTSKITDLTAATAAAGDEIPANRAGSDKKLLAEDIAALGPNRYAGIYIYDGATAQTVANGTTPIKITAFDAATGFNGLSSHCTADKVNSKITVLHAGVYYVNYSISFSNAVTPSLIWEFYVHSDGVIFPSSGAQVKMASAGDLKCLGGGGFVNVLANKDIDLRCYHSHSAGIDMTITHGNLCVRYVGT